MGVGGSARSDLWIVFVTRGAMDVPTVNDLAACKWRDFVQVFLPELQRAGFDKQALTTQWHTVATYITLAWIYRTAIDDEDEKLLRTAVEASDMENKVEILQVWDEMSSEKKARFWRFAKWFFATVLC